MTKGILGKKVGMTQIFTESGELIPVTVVEATPNVVLQVKTVETDGYEAIQVDIAPRKFIRHARSWQSVRACRNLSLHSRQIKSLIYQCFLHSCKQHLFDYTMKG